MLWPLVTLFGSVLATLAVGWIVDQVLLRVAARHREAPVWAELRRCRAPLQVVLLAGVLLVLRPLEHLFDVNDGTLRHGLLLVVIAAAGWLAVRVVAAALEAVLTGYETRTEDASRIQRVRTQIGMLRRVVSAVIWLITLAVLLLTFDAMRTVGTSLLASAGIAGIVAGIAAQSTLGNFFAGLQIAFSDTVRIGDTAVVDGQFGTVDEITLSYLVLRLWDDRRLIVPVSYFVTRPYENWSRTGPGLLAWVQLHVDHTAPLDELRTALRDHLAASEHWDGRDWSLDVLDSTPSTIVLRASATVATPEALGALRLALREHLIGYLRDHHPGALPRIRTTDEPQGRGELRESEGS